MSQIADAIVADSHSEDVRGQILEGCEAAADKLALHNPILGPDFSWDRVKQVCSFQCVAKLGAEDDPQWLLWDEEVVAGR